MGINFSQVLGQAEKGLVLKPLLHNFLMNATWENDFAVHFKKGDSRRDPDGWFHPSEHPTWPARMLYYLIAHPEAIIPEPMAYQNTLAVTVGTAMHSFIEMCLKSMNVLMEEDELRAMGFEVNPISKEPSVKDEEAGSRGHMDGVLKIFLPTHPKEPNPLFEFKTGNENALRSIEDLDLDAFIKKWPGYYAQAQDYLRMTGRQVSVVLFMQMGFPWTLKEFHIPANPKYQNDLLLKYLGVRSDLERGLLPEPCCGPGSKIAKDCLFRGVCPVGVETAATVS